MKECDECASNLGNNYAWTLSLTYGGNGGFHKRTLCSDCLSNYLSIPKERIKFFELLVTYRKQHGIPAWDWRKPFNQTWTTDLVQGFITLLQTNEICPETNYGIPIYTYQPGKNQQHHYLHHLKEKEAPTAIMHKGKIYIQATP